jgi:membrane-bound lytic murein transglycosylase B
MNRLRRALLAALCCCAGQAQIAFAQVAAPDDTAFQDFLRDVREDALARGISATTLDSVLPTIELHRRAVEEDRSQAEFVQTYERYLRRVSPRRIEQGMRLMADQGAMLGEVAAAYGVQPRFIVAIIGLESDYGTYPLREPLFDVLATLAFDERRSEQFRTELFAALEIVDKGYASVEQMKSSWAGAIGVPQFTPSNVLKLAVDHDRDGRIDLWTVGPDVIASVANYLRDAGWRADQTWGREVRLPAGGEQTLPSAETDTERLAPDAACQRYQSLRGWRELGEWQTLGVRRLDGRDLPARNLPAALILGDIGDDRGYLVYRNFCSIMRYNPAFRYALSVGLLADAIAAEPPR